MALIRPIDKVLIAGPTECGKTNLAKYLLGKSPSLRYLVYDTAGQFSNLPQFYHFAAIDWKLKAISYLPRIEENGDRVGHFERCCNLLRTRKNRILVADELRSFVAVNSIPPGLFDLIKQGRHDGIGFMGLAQDLRGMDIIMEQCQHLFVFELAGKSALEKLDNTLPCLNKRGEKQLPSEAMATLEPYQFLWWPKAHPIRKKRFFVCNPCPKLN